MLSGAGSTVFNMSLVSPFRVCASPPSSLFCLYSSPLSSSLFLSHLLSPSASLSSPVSVSASVASFPFGSSAFCSSSLYRFLPPPSSSLRLLCRIIHPYRRVWSPVTAVRRRCGLGDHEVREDGRGHPTLCRIRSRSFSRRVLIRFDPFLIKFDASPTTLRRRRHRRCERTIAGALSFDAGFSTSLYPLSAHSRSEIDPKPAKSRRPENLAAR